MAWQMTWSVDYIHGAILEEIQCCREEAQWLPLEFRRIDIRTMVCRGQFRHPTVVAEQIWLEVLVRTLTRKSVLDDMERTVAHHDVRGRKVLWVSMMVVMHLQADMSTSLISLNNPSPRSHHPWPAYMTQYHHVNVSWFESASLELLQ